MIYSSAFSRKDCYDKNIEREIQRKVSLTNVRRPAINALFYKKKNNVNNFCWESWLVLYSQRSGLYTFTFIGLVNLSPDYLSIPFYDKTNLCSF